MPAIAIPVPSIAAPRKPKRFRGTPELANGDRLGACEFMRRYKAMPEVKKAELINGIVYMASPVRIDLHSCPDNLIQTCLGTYSAMSPGAQAAANGTVRLSPDDVVQPDAFLRLDEEHGGQSRIDEKGYLEGAPELVIEIAASTASIDVRDKLHSYRRAGVREYIVWRTQDGEIDVWRLEEDQFVPHSVDENGVWKSLVFPGLWLNLPALLDEAGDQVLATLQQGMASPEHQQLVQPPEADANKKP